MLFYDHSSFRHNKAERVGSGYHERRLLRIEGEFDTGYREEASASARDREGTKYESYIIYE